MKKIYFWLIIAVVLVIAAVYMLSTASPADTDSHQNREKVVFYKISDQQKPNLKILGESFQDLGTMKVSDTRSASFTIQNIGQKPLQIFYGSTNCGCTFGQIKKEAEQSPVFGMHANNQFNFAIAPGEEAKVELVYKPFLMPVYGKVQRVVRLKTNDPEHPEVTFIIEALVE